MFGCGRASIKFNREFATIVAGCGVFLVVAGRIKVTVDAVNAFADRMPEARVYFAEYADRGCRFAGAIAELYVDPSVAACAEKRGLIVLGTGEDLMTVLNTPGFTSRAC